jgi:signal peptidase I
LLNKLIPGYSKASRKPAPFVICMLLISGVLSCINPLTYVIPSGSMEDTFAVGEKFFVTPSKDFERYDVVVYDKIDYDYSRENENGTFDKASQRFVMRLVAFSGDKLELRRGELFVNDEKIKEVPTIKYPYLVIASEQIPLPEDRNKLVPDVVQISHGPEYRYDALLSFTEYKEWILNKPAIKSITRIVDTVPIPSEIGGLMNINNKPVSTGWSVDNFGPLTIPSPGDEITVDSASFNELYHDIPGIKIGKNIVREKLYFVLGDNRHRARDSRFTGYITHSKMYGVVKGK